MGLSGLGRRIGALHSDPQAALHNGIQNIHAAREKLRAGSRVGTQQGPREIHQPPRELADYLGASPTRRFAYASRR
jgi:hypothetical protein